jgi:hypothetical protein
MWNGNNSRSVTTGAVCARKWSQTGHPPHEEVLIVGLGYQFHRRAASAIDDMNTRRQHFPDQVPLLRQRGL